MFKSSLSQKTRQQLNATLEQLNKMRDELKRYDGFQNLKVQQINNEPLSQLAYKDFIVYYQQIAQLLKTLQLDKNDIDKNYPAIKLSLDKLKEKKYLPSSQKGRELSEMESGFQDLMLSYERRNQYVKNLVKSTRSDYHNYSIHDIDEVLKKVNSYLIEQKEAYNQVKTLLENIVKLENPILKQLIETNAAKLPLNIKEEHILAINSLTDRFYNDPSELMKAIEQYNITLTLEQCELINQEAMSIYIKNSRQERMGMEQQLQKVDVLLDSLKNWKDIKENSDVLDDRSEEEQINIIEESLDPIAENVNTAPIVENIDTAEILPESIVELENAHNIEARMQLWLNTSLANKEQGSQNWSNQDNNKYKYNIAILNEPDNDLVGTNNKLEIRVFNKNSYYGFQVEDLVERLMSVCTTIISQVPDNIDRREELLNWIAQYQQIIAKQIVDDSQKITEDRTTEREKNKKKSTKELISEEQFKEAVDKEIIERGKVLIGQYLVDVLHAVMPGVPVEEALKIMQKAEGNVVANNGRSNFIHLYEVDSVQAIQRFSAAQTIGKETIPSTVRDRPQLANYMRMACGYRDESNHLHVDFVGYRHSSYPLIQIKSDNLNDKLMRREGAVTAVMEMLTELAKQKLQGKDANDYAENPLTISLSTLALFSPLRIHTGREGEERQLKETQLALKMLHNQTLDLTVIIDQQPVKIKIKPDCTLMNGPSNVLTRFTAIDNLQDQVNAQGFYELTKNIDSYIQ